MKKYIIKYADGSKQYHMKAEHKSRKEAGETLRKYICSHSNPINGCYPSPFDFTLEEVDVKDVNETITDFESARETLGLKPNVAYIPKSGDVKRLVTDINPKYIKALIALNKLFTIAEAWNKEDKFVPDFSDGDQYKWYPSFIYDKRIARYVYYRSSYAVKYATSSSGARLCFKTPERAEQFGKQFEDLYNKVFL